tara:strand:+ start:2216 stop:2668 length:453 start_codon:yes stop_codon:yes gene_type:complete
MIKKIKNLITNLSAKEEIVDEMGESKLNNACAALLVEVAFADKDFDEREKESLKVSLLETYNLEEDAINEIILDAEKTIEESTSLYGYTRIVNDEFEYENKLDLLRNLWKVAFADGYLDKYEEHLLRKISDLIHISHSDYINIKLEIRGD